MMNLPKLPNVSKISSKPKITRILGQNPGQFTLQGTNTYLIWGEKRRILIDTGEGSKDYLKFLGPEISSSSDRSISDIILTHWHNDHAGGLESVLDLIDEKKKKKKKVKEDESSDELPKVWKFKLPQSDRSSRLRRDRGEGSLINEDNESYLEERKMVETIESFGKGGGSERGLKIEWLEDGKEFEIDENFKLRAIRTPGHTKDSGCFLMFEKDSTLKDREGFRLRSIFVGDTLLGGSTTVFEDLKTYLGSLKLLSDLIRSLNQNQNVSEKALGGEDESGVVVPLYPGHGEVIEDGQSEIKKIYDHRIDRENQIIKLLSNPKLLDPDRCITLDKIVDEIYKDYDLTGNLRLAARRGILQHLEKLEDDKVVIEFEHDRWRLI